MSNLNQQPLSTNATALQSIFRPELESLQTLIAGMESPDFKNLAGYFKGLNELKNQSRKHDPTDTLGWGAILDQSVMDGFTILAKAEPNGENIAIIRRLLESAGRAANSNKVKQDIVNYKLALGDYVSSFSQGEVYEDAASSGGSSGWLLWILFIVIFDVLSLTFDFGWILY